MLAAALRSAPAVRPWAARQAPEQPLARPPRAARLPGTPASQVSYIRVAGKARPYLQLPPCCHGGASDAVPRSVTVQSSPRCAVHC